MADIFFTVAVQGPESLAEDLAWVCEKVFGVKPALFSRLEGDPPGYSFVVRAKATEDVADWRLASELLASAMGSMDGSLVDSFMAPWQEKIDRLARCAKAARAARPEAAVTLVPPEGPAVPLDRASGRRLIWRVWR